MLVRFQPPALDTVTAILVLSTERVVSRLTMQEKCIGEHGHANITNRGSNAQEDIMKKKVAIICLCLFCSSCIERVSEIPKEKAEEGPVGEIISVPEVIIEPVEEVIEEVIIEEPIEKTLPVCYYSSVKSYMDYKAITNKSSEQYKYIKAYMTVNEKGLLVDEDGYIGIALGSYFGDIGSKYQITFSTGLSINVVKIEAKADIHTNNGCEQMYDKSVIEFVVDVDKAGEYYGVSSNGYILSGNFNNHRDFYGTIQKIVIK